VQHTACAYTTSIMACGTAPAGSCRTQVHNQQYRITLLCDTLRTVVHKQRSAGALSVTLWHCRCWRKKRETTHSGDEWVASSPDCPIPVQCIFEPCFVCGVIWLDWVGQVVCITLDLVFGCRLHAGNVGPAAACTGGPQGLTATLAAAHGNGNF
jgi:hypothetical protein